MKEERGNMRKDKKEKCTNLGKKKEQEICWDGETEAGRLGDDVWIVLPHNIHQTESLKIFKTKLKPHIILI